MTVKKTVMSDIHYYSETLKNKLNYLLHSPAVIVEAPSGYGKTTAVRDYLAHKLPKGAEVRWFTAVDEAPESSYGRLCLEFKKIDADAGDRLLKAGLPNALNIGETCEAIRSIKCKRETWLVIDNFQYLNEILPASILIALLEHDIAGLHIVIITHMLGRDVHSTIASRGFLHITVSDLRLGEDDVRHYFSLAGVKINKEEAQMLVRYTEGWIIALYLQLRAFLERGVFSDTEIISLMDSLFWEKLDKRQQNFLLHLSPFEMVTAQQASFLAKVDTLPAYAINALQSSFIRYESNKCKYEFHTILSQLLQVKLKESNEAFERECLIRAGDWCCNKGKIKEAMTFYLRTEDYKRILSLDFTDLIFDEIQGKAFFHIALNIMQNCPAEIKKDAPLSMLRVAWALKAGDMNAEFAKILEEINLMIEPCGLLRAEWMLLSAYKFYPFIDKMMPILEEAAPMFEGECSQVILPGAPWCFGDYSQMTVFHRKSGEGDREAEELEKFIRLYSEITGDHGSGADTLFKAELAHFRGDLDLAEILIHKAIFIAESKGQSIVQLGATLHLCEIAVERCDFEAWDKAFCSMEHAAALQNNALIRSVLDILRGILLNELGYQDRIADWLKNMGKAEILFSTIKNNAIFAHLCYLMHKGDYARMIGVTQAVKEAVLYYTPFGNSIIFLLMAIGYINMGDKKRALESLNKSMETAIPDGFLYLLAVHHWMLKGLSEEVIADKFPEYLELYIKIKERFFIGYNKLHTNLITDSLTDLLTAREREIALLAAKGLKNTEIAKEMFITENTVRSHLHSAYQKLDIDRRSRLADKLM